MKRNKSWKPLYEGLKRDEIELLEWYHDNPLSVYIEISLITMADIGIITEEEHKAYMEKVAENAGRLREYLRKRGNGSAMDKDALKGFLFDVMKEYDELFEDISLDDGTDTLFVTAVDGERFIVTVSPVTADETLIELWAKKNPKLMALALGILNMRDLGGFTETEADKYLGEILERANNPCIGDIKKMLGKPVND